MTLLRGRNACGGYERAKAQQSQKDTSWGYKQPDHKAQIRESRLSNAFGLHQSSYGRGCSVGRGRGVGEHLPVHGVGVGVAVGPDSTPRRRSSRLCCHAPPTRSFQHRSTLRYEKIRRQEDLWCWWTSNCPCLRCISPRYSSCRKNSLLPIPSSRYQSRLQCARLCP